MLALTTPCSPHRAPASPPRPAYTRQRRFICPARARDYDFGVKTGHGAKSEQSGSTLSSLISIDTEGPWIAFAGPAEEGCTELTELCMKIYFHSQPGEHLHLTGNHPSFGSWDLDRAFPLKWTPNHVWVMESPILVEPGTTLEYKYVLFRDGEEEPVWQGGKNAVVHVPEDSEGCRFVVEDSWDASRHDHHLEKHKVDEHSLAQPIPSECFACGLCLMPHLHWRTCPRYQALRQGTAPPTVQQLPPLSAV